jgi:hypothetical protein
MSAEKWPSITKKSNMADSENSEILSCKQEFISLLPSNYAYFVSNIERAKDSKDDYTVTFRIKDISTEEKARVRGFVFIRSSPQAHADSHHDSCQFNFNFNFNLFWLIPYYSG